MIVCLLGFGADADTPARDGKTPRGLAEASKNPALKEAFSQHSKKPSSGRAFGQELKVNRRSSLSCHPF